MTIIWTKNAEERQKEWEKRIGVTRQEVEDLAIYPVRIVPDDMDALVAQTKTRKGLLRCPFVEIEGKIKLLTVYDKRFKGG